MAGVLKRVGYVILSVVVFSIVGTLLAFAFGLVKGVLSGGGPVGLDDAAIFGVGWFGAMGGICGPLMGREVAKERGGRSSRGAEAAGWIVGVIAALICLSVLLRS